MNVHLLSSAKDGSLRMDFHAVTMMDLAKALQSVVEGVLGSFGTDERFKDAKAAVWAESMRVAKASNILLFGASDPEL